MTDDVTPKKRQAFIDAFRDKGTVKAACAECGISRQTAYRWRQADEDFALAWHEAEEDITEELEREARRRAAEGTLKPVYHQGKAVGAVREFSDTLLIFLLKARKPETYRERFEVKHDGKVAHTHSAPEIGNPKAQKIAHDLLEHRAANED